MPQGCAVTRDGHLSLCKCHFGLEPVLCQMRPACGGRGWARGGRTKHGRPHCWREVAPRHGFTAGLSGSVNQFCCYCLVGVNTESFILLIFPPRLGWFFGGLCVLVYFLIESWGKGKMGCSWKQKKVQRWLANSDLRSKKNLVWLWAWILNSVPKVKTLLISNS